MIECTTESGTKVMIVSDRIVTISEVRRQVGRAIASEIRLDSGEVIEAVEPVDKLVQRWAASQFGKLHGM